VRVLKTAKLKYAQAAIEELDSRSTRGIERSVVMSLALRLALFYSHSIVAGGLLLTS
jgi:hypothetical protein